MSQNMTMDYYGKCETELRSRYNNHSQTFKFESKKYATKLSKAVRDVKDVVKLPLKNWSILKPVIPNQCGLNTSQLCLAQKMTILQLNKK